MVIQTKTITSAYFTDEDRASLKKWAKNKGLKLKDLAEELCYNYKAFIHVVNGRKSINEYALNKLKEMGWNYEIHE